MMKSFWVTPLIFTSFVSMASTSLNLELGSAQNSYNKVKISGEEGSLFNMARALDSESYYRLSLSHKFNSPHGIRFLYAPLKFAGDKTYSKDIELSGTSFPAGNRTKAEYQFNSYRGTYFYEIESHKNFLLRLGGTLKVRDAKVQLQQAGRKKFKKNTGVVPLLYLYSMYKWDNGLTLAVDFDGLAAPQGRAFDVALMGGYLFSQNLNLSLGYRMLEGGVDNEKVYNFSQVNYYFTSFTYHF